MWSSENGSAMRNIKHALLVYEVISYNPIISAVNILAVKLGLNKTIIMVILAFLL